MKIKGRRLGVPDPAARAQRVRLVSVQGLKWRVVGLLLGLVLAASCQSYHDGQSRTVGELTDDSTIHLKVKSRLIADKEVKGLRLNVEVERGVVSLHGRVASQDMRLRALEIAGSVKGVASVEDHLSVDSP